MQLARLLPAEDAGGGMNGGSGSGQNGGGAQQSGRQVAVKTLRQVGGCGGVASALDQCVLRWVGVGLTPAAHVPGMPQAQQPARLLLCSRGAQRTAELFGRRACQATSRSQPHLLQELLEDPDQVQLFVKEVPGRSLIQRVSWLADGGLGC